MCNRVDQRLAERDRWDVVVIDALQAVKGCLVMVVPLEEVVGVCELLEDRPEYSSRAVNVVLESSENSAALMVGRALVGRGGGQGWCRDPLGVRAPSVRSSSAPRLSSLRRNSFVANSNVRSCWRDGRVSKESCSVCWIIRRMEDSLDGRVAAPLRMKTPSGLGPFEAR